MKDYPIPILDLLLKCYIELNRISAEPGDRAHMLAYSIKFIERQIKGILKDHI